MRRASRTGGAVRGAFRAVPRAGRAAPAGPDAAAGTPGVRRGGAARSAAAVVGTLALAVLATACGIRTTSVPVDAAGAPSRMPCEVPHKSVITQAQPGVPVRVYLVCSSELESVERAARIPEERSLDARREFAQALLDELQAQPPAAEREAGFSTSVRGTLIVAASRPGDPEGSLRLSRQPEDLPTTALAQIVCTFAESEATDGRVLLGGPGDYPPRGYRCSEQTKNRPDESVPTLGPSPSSASSGTRSPSPGSS